MNENRLIHEKSPYLLQHAHNPVNWYPWGKEAFAKARTEEKPIFLSIGYSTCHWCHVMERESFEDEEVAALLNRAFVSIKVDREERPDIDSVYMTICQSMTGSGGWPLTILMTPDQKSFLAATYLPKHNRYGQTGLIELLTKIEQIWKNDRKQLLTIGDDVAASVFRSEASPSAPPDRSLLHTAAQLFRRIFDTKNGGFGSAPKFPTPHNLLFLMRYAQLEQDKSTLQMVETTLEQMARGGIFDQIGGGFSRYSTDDQWLVPHFEKMLYDNALLAYSYLEAYACTRRSFYQTIAERTLDYVLRELTSPEGGFYCGQDADSDGEEGKYYLFTPKEVKTVLETADARLFCNWFDITPSGNFEGKSIPNLLNNQQYEYPDPKLDKLYEKLYQYRLNRTKLHRDDKVLTSWNALMIVALAKSYQVSSNQKHLEAAYRARDFLQKNLTTPDGRLYLRWRDGEAAIHGQLDDYAFYAWALLELYAADFNVDCLKDAIQLMKQISKHFSDEHGGFFLTADDAEALITRPKESYDGAIPSGNAVAGLVLARIWKLTGEQQWRQATDQQLAFLAGNAQGYPIGHSFALLALCEELYPSRELICASATEEVPNGLQKITEKYHLHTLLKTPKNAQTLAQFAPFSAAYPIPEQGTAYYLCKNGACTAPVSALEELEGLLRADKSNNFYSLNFDD